MKVRFSTLSRDDQERVYLAALSVLEKVGVRVKSGLLFRSMKDIGLPADEATETIRVPRSVVVEALAAAPRRWLPTNQAGEVLPLPDDQPYFIARVLLNWVWDHDTGQPRPPRKRDIVDLIRLSRALKDAHVVYKVDAPCNDVAGDVAYLETIATVYRTTKRHILANPINPQSTRYYVELNEVASGRPIDGRTSLLCGIAATSPLTIDRDTGDSLVYLLEKGAAVNCFGMPISGASSPLTLAGTVVQHTAEVLAIITMVQLKKPGTCVGYGGMSTVLDMRSGSLSMAAPSVNLLTNATTTMANYFGLPAYTAANYTDASSPDVQCGVEKALSCLVGAAAGSRVGMFGGDLADAMTVSYEQMLIDHDIWRVISHLTRGMRVDAGTLAQDVIERVGHSDAIMTDAHTLEWLRSDEHCFGQLFVRGNPQTQPTMLQRAHAEVESILAKADEAEVEQEVVERIDRYVREETLRIRTQSK